MKQAWALLLVTTLLATVAMGQAPRAAEPDAGKAMADLVAKTRGTLGIVEFTLNNEMTNKPLGQPVAGMAICVNADANGAKKATLITSVLGGEVLPSLVTGTQVYIPGVEKPLRATYLATDPGSGITFVRVEDPYDWQAVGFAPKANLSMGKQVFSVGLLDAWTGFEPYLGLAQVSAQLRVPGPLVYVTGGNLTNIGSPVFNAEGQGIGMVLQQLPNVVTLSGAGGAGGNVVVSSQRETSCFVPVDDFAYILKNPPLPGKRPSWTGIGLGTYMQSVSPLLTPAVKVAKVIPGSPAAKAGVNEADVVIQFNGQNLDKLPTMDLVRMNLEQMLARLPVGAEFTLTMHAKPNAPIKIKAEERPPTPRDAEKYFNELLGLVVREKVDLDQYLDPSPVTSKEEGLYVVGVVKDTPAANAGLKGGPDINLIVTVNTKPVKKVADFRQIVETELGKNPKAAINLLVHQGARSTTITIQP